MASSRDNFTQKTIQTLRERVAGFCSNPRCNKQTFGPSSEAADKSTIIGKAAHITAAAVNGPRYDASLSRELRRGIENAIWLCSDCSDLIDKDVSDYPVELLLKWKAQAENQAKAKRGRAEVAQQEKKLIILPEQSTKLIGRVDILDKLKNAITQPQSSSHLLVNGMGGVGKTAICKALAHKVVNQVNAVVWLDGQSGLELALQSKLPQQGKIILFCNSRELFS